MESEPKVLTRGSGLVNIAQLLDFLLHFIFYAYRWLLDTDLWIIVTVLQEMLCAITVTLFDKQYSGLVVYQST